MHLSRLRSWLSRLSPARCLRASAVLLLLATGAAHAVDDQTALPDFFRESWTTRDGLPHNSANAIAQTPDGYLWFATWEGTARFNGRQFVNFDREAIPGLPDSGIRTLRTTRDGTLLAGGSRGTLARLVAGRWEVLPSVVGLVNDVYQDRAGHLWVATDGDGVLRIDAQGRRRSYGPDQGLPSEAVYGFAEDGAGHLWAATGAGLARLNADRWEPLPAGLGLPSGPTAALSVAPSGQLLVASERGAYRSQFVGDAWPRFALAHAELADVVVTRLLGSDDGSLWVGTLSQGLWRVGRRGVERLGTQAGLPNSRIIALFRDREDNLWVGTNGGVFRLSDAAFSTVNRDRGLSDDFTRTVLERADGSLWIGTSRGLNRLDANGVAVQGQTEFERSLAVLSLADAGDQGVWTGTYGQGLHRWRDGRIVESLDRGSGLPSSEVRAVLVARDGALWAGTTQGVAIRRHAGVEVLNEHDGLPSDYVVALQQSADGAIWIGTSAGVARWWEGRLQPIELPASTGAEMVFGFHDDVDAGVLWMATDRGLLRYAYSTGRIGVVGLAQGLPFDKVFSVVAGPLDGLWIGGNRGVFRMDRRQAMRVADGEQPTLEGELFTESDGMASAQCNGGSGPAATLRADGTIAFATAIGVARVEPSRLRLFAQSAPPVAIEALQADGETFDVGAAIRLPAGTRRVEIEFAGLAFVMAERIRYRYRLDGHDGDWVNSGTDADAEFTALPPGDYVLHVQAAHPRGEWSEREATLHFSVDPHWWQRRWVQAIAALLAILTLLGSIAARWRAVAARERELRRVVDERTRELQRQTALLAQSDAEKSRLLETVNEQARVASLQAREDALTGVANRRAFDELLAAEFDRSRRTNTPLTLAMLDIDHFKQVNDRHSHAVGDTVLQRIAALMREHCRGMDRVARWGGEEFALLLPHTRLDEAHQVAERLRAAIANTTFDDLANGLSITASIGLAERDDSQRHEDLVAKADAALYRAKHGGRNRVEG